MLKEFSYAVITEDFEYSGINFYRGEIVFHTKHSVIMRLQHETGNGLTNFQVCP